MSIVVAALSLVLWLVLVPFFIGLAFNFILPRPRRTAGITFILGFLMYMAVFEVVAIACMTRIVYDAFSICCRFFMIASLLLALAGVVRTAMLLFRGEKNFLTLFPGEAHAQAQDLMNPRSDPLMFKLDYSKESLIYWGIFFVIMIFQMVMSVVMASFDGDDAYYVVESLLAQQAGVMNTILPYTGTSTSLDIRHALAVITMWIGFVAKKSDIHATILSHSILPLFFIPMVYLVYVEIGRILFRRRQHVIPVFMVFIAVLMMFGNVSIYTPATFFLMRTWQGKALVANLVFPMIVWMFLWMFEDIKPRGKGLVFDNKDSALMKHTSVAENVARYQRMSTKRERISPWVILGLINMFSGVCSSMGVIFGSALVGLFTLILLFFSRRWTVLVGAFLCILPNLAYLAVYFSL
ncbi:MAG: hypothetical protein E7307_00120 [Butyrivibrio sp.]|nr:hypothetical protein [Butyrivibrio sp.]